VKRHADARGDAASTLPAYATEPPGTTGDSKLKPTFGTLIFSLTSTHRRRGVRLTMDVNVSDILRPDRLPNHIG
jgi:hypothetical protein